MCVPNNVNNNNSYSTGILIIRDNFIQRKKKNKQSRVFSYYFRQSFKIQF